MTQKIYKLRKYPLEKEAADAMRQYQISTLGRGELEDYAKRASSLMSRLTHYSEQMLNIIEEEGVKLLPPE
jgi:hypothetical protein